MSEDRSGPYAVLQPAVEKVRFAAIVEIDCEATDVCFEFNGASHSHEPMCPPIKIAGRKQGVASRVRKIYPRKSLLPFAADVEINAASQGLENFLLGNHRKMLSQRLLASRTNR